MELRNLELNFDPLSLEPIGIWQDTYFILKAAYTIQLKNKVLKIKSNKETKIIELNCPIGKILEELLNSCDIKNPKLFGFFAYDYVHNLENITKFIEHKEHPEVSLIIPETYLIKKENNFEIVGNLNPVERNKNENANLNKQINLSKWHKSKEDFSELANLAKKFISEGDIYQVVISNKLLIEKEIDPYQLYKQLLSRNPSAYHFLYKFDNSFLIGASPETMLHYTESDRKMCMRLIAGTYPKIKNQYQNDITNFSSDPKELAEHMMLVDHCRNDLGKVAKTGSVKVTDLLKIETLHDVYHLVSQVEANLKENLNCFDALDSCFPIATLTGTPKIRAMEIISELEQIPRGLFGGAVGMFDNNGNADLAVIIRSAILNNKKCEIYAGAGIVADSIAEREFEECTWKAQALKDIISR